MVESARRKDIIETLQNRLKTKVHEIKEMRKKLMYYEKQNLKGIGEDDIVGRNDSELPDEKEPDTKVSSVRWFCQL